MSEKPRNDAMQKLYEDIEDAEYLIARLERVVELLHEGNIHMATAKLLADISALKAL